MNKDSRKFKYGIWVIIILLMVLGLNLFHMVYFEVFGNSHNMIFSIVLVLANSILFFVFAWIVIRACNQDTLKIENLAYKDYETNMYNYNYLIDNYKNIVTKSELGKYSYVSIDIDNFKYINNIMGYEKGTEILCIVSETIRENIHEDEVAIRTIGDVFGVLLHEDIQQIIVNRIEDIFNKIKIKVGEKYTQRINFAFSSGVYTITKSEDTIKSVVDKANAARKAAKNMFNKNIEFYNKEMEDNIKNRIDIEEDMEDALKNKEFIVYLQPKVNMITGKLYGAEALARWQHKTKGFLMPGSFIPIFEENGFIMKLDYYIFESVCVLKKKWAAECRKFPIVSINMSRLHIYEKNFIRNLVEIAEKYGVPTSELEIEVTENAFFEDANMLLSFTEELKFAGFSVSIDDFGSGFSSLNMLKDVCADVLKIDRKFLISTDKNDNRAKKILKNVIAMARDLKIDIVTEGVETSDQIELLTNYGCEIAQGFYYAKPMSVEEYEKFATIHGAGADNKSYFKFNGDFKNEFGDSEAVPVGEGFEFVDGPIKNEKCLKLPGGAVSTNYISLPIDNLKDESYTISLWMLTESIFGYWCSLIYAEYENGFMSYMPIAWNGSMSYRIKDDTYNEGWHDTHYPAVIKVNQWYHVAITYNAKLEVARLYVNGEAVGYRRKVPTLRGMKCLYIGGDIYQPSMSCYISNVFFTDDVKSSKEIWEMYEKVKSNM